MLAAGGDYIAHSVRDQPVDAAFIAQFRARDVCVSPTLMREVSTFVYETRPSFFDDPFFTRGVDIASLTRLSSAAYQESIRAKRSAQRYKAALEVAKANLKRLSDAGVRIAFGTDTGPAARFQGYFEHMELELMVQAGLTPMQAIVSATGDAARCMGVADTIGTLETGRAADFVVFAETRSRTSRTRAPSSQPGYGGQGAEIGQVQSQGSRLRAQGQGSRLRQNLRPLTRRSCSSLEP